jgi:hypothetical protein
LNLSEELRELLALHQDKRVVVVGTTCSGKTTLLSGIPNAADMDALLFPQLTVAEAAYVCQTPWTADIGKAMDRLAKQRIQVKPGTPVFGTVVLDCDLIVFLHISDELLQERCAARKVSFTDAKNMQLKIKQAIEISELATVDFAVG